MVKQLSYNLAGKLLITGSLLCLFSRPIMAWRSHGKNNADLVRNMKKNGVITKSEVENVMLKVDRGNYVKYNAYQDSPQGIGYGVTISAPHMHAFALSLLTDYLKPGNSALDVGSGSGYLTACMATMIAGEGGRAVGIDHIPELIDMTKANINKDNPQLLTDGVLNLIVGDGRQGHAALAPYHAIHVGAAAAELPQTLVDQLALGGRLVIPVGTSQQSIETIDKLSDGRIERNKLMGVVYVPLTDREAQWPGRSEM